MTAHTGLLWELPLTTAAPARYLARFGVMPTTIRGREADRPDNLHLMQFIEDDTITPGHVLITSEEVDDGSK
jgi:hypothetical protein